jgi:hypothetical protein
MRSLKSNNLLKNIFVAQKFQKKFNSFISKKFNILIGKNKIKKKEYKRIKKFNFYKKNKKRK